MGSEAPDGFTFFGSMPDVYEMDQIDQTPTNDQVNDQKMNSIIVNDFVIPSRNQQTAEQHRGQHF